MITTSAHEVSSHTGTPTRGVRRAITLWFVLLLLTSCTGSGSTRHSPAAAPTTASPQPGAGQVQVWITDSNGNRKLSRSSPVPLSSQSLAGADVMIVSVNDSQQFQRFFGVGASITGSSAQLLGQLPAQTRQQALAQLFSRTDGIGLSVLRQPLGANDFSIGNHTYDDLPAGTTDPGLAHFSLGGDATQILPLLRSAQQLNPAATVVVSPWSAPAWMKSTGSLVGGALSGQFYDSYARYLVRSVRAYTDAGVRVGGITPQNEPSFSPSGYPGMILTAAQQKELVVGHLRPALSAAGLNNVGIWALDDNYDRIADAQVIVSDGAARSAIAGVAFHCYQGDVSTLKDFHAQYPDVALAISECTGGDWSANFADNLRYDVHTLLIDGIRDGASWVSKWNVALDESGGPSNGGCTNCRGLITVNPDNGSVSYNEAFYAFGHLGRFVTPGARVIASNGFGDGSLDTVAFLNPDGSHVLLATNGAADPKTFQVQSSGRQFRYTLSPGAVATFTW